MADTPREFRITITFDDGREPKVVTVRQGKVKMKVMRELDRIQRLPADQQSLGEIVPAIAGVLRITPEEADEIEWDEWQRFLQELQASMNTNIPNESAPPIEQP